MRQRITLSGYSYWLSNGFNNQLIQILRFLSLKFNTSILATCDRWSYNFKVAIAISTTKYRVANVRPTNKQYHHGYFEIVNFTRRIIVFKTWHTMSNMDVKLCGMFCAHWKLMSFWVKEYVGLNNKSSSCDVFVLPFVRWKIAALATCIILWKLFLWSNPLIWKLYKSLIRKSKFPFLSNRRKFTHFQIDFELKISALEVTRIKIDILSISCISFHIRIQLESQIGCFTT